MKKTIVILGCLCISFASFGHTPLEFNDNPDNVCTESAASKWYVVLATTDNGIGENYSISAKVQATCIGESCSVHDVVVEGRSVYYSSFGNKYSFTYGSYKYYFRF